MTTKNTWKIDPAHTSIEFAVTHMMFTTVRGRFKDFNGTVEVDERNPDSSIVNVEIAAASIDTGVADRDAHLRSADFLDAANKPSLKFRSKRIEGAAAKPGDRFRLIGDLTIRDTTMEVVLDAEFEGTGKDPWGGTRAGYKASTRIDRKKKSPSPRNTRSFTRYLGCAQAPPESPGTRHRGTASRRMTHDHDPQI